MSDQFLEGYDGQSTEELLALEGQFRIDSLVLAFEQAIQSRSVESLTTEETYVPAVEGLEREVNNGGYNQFFTNSSVEFVTTIEAALRAIDCSKTADITRALSGCDDRYFANDEPIADRLFRWIATNKHRIRVGGA